MPLPEPLLQSLENVQGFDRASFEAVHASGEQLTSIRLNPFKHPLHQQWDDARQVPWCLHGKYLSARPSFTLDPLFHAGAYYVQEASSMFLWQVLEQTVGHPSDQKILDLCAAPGGKSTLLTSYCKEGLLVSNEVIKSRAAVLVENMTKWGSMYTVITNNDPVHFQSLPGYFDVIVVDAPCSGSGLFRKDPAAIEEWSEDNVMLCSQRQQRILADVMPALKQNGILIYATCSYSAAEDEHIADWLAGEQQMESIRISVQPEWNIVETSSASHHAFGYRFYPDKVQGEGFFIAAFRKRADDRQKKLKELVLTVPSKQDMQLLAEKMSLPDQLSFFKQSDAIRAIPERWLRDVKVLANHLYIKKAGVEIGSIKGKDIIPSHELAMSLLPLDHFSSVTVSAPEALQYLRRQDLLLSPDKGWHLIYYNGLPLGWIKALPNRINNYYPAEWRIRKQ